MRQHNNNNNNNNRRPVSSGGGRHQPQQQHNNNNNGRYRRTNAQTRTNAIYDRDEMSDIVTPQQSRHATNQQTKFLDLAKNAKQLGDRVEMEYYMQHVEHYTRVLNLAEAQESARLQERQVRHQPRIQQTDDSEDEEIIEAAEGVELTPEEEAERQARMERNRLRRRHRRQRRNSYERGEQQVAQGESAQRDSESQHTSENHVTPPAPPQEAVAAQSAQEKAPRTTRPYKRRTVAQPDMLESNSGALLQDILPTARLDD